MKVIRIEMQDGASIDVALENEESKLLSRNESGRKDLIEAIYAAFELVAPAEPQDLVPTLRLGAFAGSEVRLIECLSKAKEG